MNAESWAMNGVAVRLATGAAGVLLLTAGGTAHAAVVASWVAPTSGGVATTLDPNLTATPLKVGAGTVNLEYWSNGWTPRVFTFDLTVPAGMELTVTDWSVTVRCDNGPMTAALSTSGAGAFALGSVANVSGAWGEFKFTAIDTSPDALLGPGTYTVALSFNNGDSGWWAALQTYTINGEVAIIPEPSALALAALGGLGLLRRRRS